MRWRGVRLAEAARSIGRKSAWVGLAMAFGGIWLQAQGQKSDLERAMRDEMARSISSLQLNDLGKPYFIAYRVTETESVAATATFGALVSSNAEPATRAFSVYVRVGDYSLDNTNFAAMPSMESFNILTMPGGELPMDGNYQEVRRKLWLATDGAYKKAVEEIAAKRAALQNETQTETLSDLSKEEPLTLDDEQPPISLDRASVESLARELSAEFRGLPDVYKSSVSVNVRNRRLIYLNSEGTFYVRSAPSVDVRISEQTQAADGMSLGDSIAFYGRSFSSLPSKAELAARIREMASRLKNLGGAPLLARYSGPVLFEKEAAAELFAESFAPALLAHRSPLASGQMAQVLTMMAGSRGNNSFEDKIGSRVLPDWMSVADNATLADFGGKPLLGGYRADDEGVRSRENKVISDGIVSILLNGRNPAPGMLHSTGNFRGAGVTPSNLIVQVRNGLSSDEIKAELLKQVAKRNLPFGVVVRRVGAPSGTNFSEMLGDMVAASMGQGTKSKRVLLAYKVFPDGHEELVRGAELTGLNAASFKDLLAATKEEAVYSTAFGGGGDLSEMIGSFVENLGTAGPDLAGNVVTYVVPGLLFEDASFSRRSEQVPKPPYLAAPAIEKYRQ